MFFKAFNVIKNLIKIAISTANLQQLKNKFFEVELEEKKKLQSHCKVKNY
jgi:hypothetical protein